MKRALVALLAAVALAAVAVSAGIGDRTLKRLLPDRERTERPAPAAAVALPPSRAERQLATLRGPRPKPSGLARLDREPAPTVFLAPDGSDEADCTRADPCLTFARGYQRARPGAVVELAGGTYGEQMLLRDATKTSDADVVFRPAPRAEVRTGGIAFGDQTTQPSADHVTVRDITITAFLTQRTRDLTLYNVTIDGNFWVQGGSDVRIIGGSAGGTQDNTSPQIVAWQDGDVTDRPTDVLVDGVLFHDVRMKTADGHVECLQSTDAIRLTIRNSRFARCDVFNVRVDRRWADAPEDILIESNVFDQTTASIGGNVYYGLAVGSGDGVVIRNNSGVMPWAGPGPDSPTKGFEVVGNAMPGAGCDGRVAYRYNLWHGGQVCGATDRGGDPLFREPRAGDLRLRPGSPARDAGDPRSFAQIAFDGRPRPRGRGPDIGASEG